MFKIYKPLFQVPNYTAYFYLLVFSRLSSWMWGTVIVLFILDKYQSPALSGLAVLLTNLPGILLSPFSGSFAKRFKYKRVIIFTAFFSALTTLLIAALSAMGVLDFWLFLTLCLISSIVTVPGGAASNSMFVQVVPSKHYDQANALTNIVQETAVIIGPSLGGTIFGLLNANMAILAVGIITLLGGLVAFKLPHIESQEDENKSILQDTMAGLRNIVKNETVRGLAVAVPFYAMTFGILTTALPIMLEERFAADKSLVGWLWMMIGFSSLMSNLVFGRLNTQNKERFFLMLGIVISMIGFGIVTFSHHFYLTVIGFLFIGGTQGLVDINLSSLKQRRTDPNFYGHITTISYALIGLGIPVGASLAGFILETSLLYSLGMTLVVSAISYLLIYMMVPRFHNKTVVTAPEAINNAT